MLELRKNMTFKSYATKITTMINNILKFDKSFLQIEAVFNFHVINLLHFASSAFPTRLFKKLLFHQLKVI